MKVESRQVQAAGDSRTPRPGHRKAVAPAAAALALTLFLSGCGSLVPPAGAPQADLRADFRDRSDPPLTADAAAAHAWDGFFADERLRRVVGLALSGNRSLRAGVAAVERARALYGITAAARWPEVEAGASANRQGTIGSSGGVGTTSRSYTVSLGITAWEIDLFDRVGSLQGAALARYLSQQETQNAAQLALVADVAEAWLALGAERQRLLLAEELRDSQQRTLSLTERQYQLGAASGLQLARAQTAFEAARGEAARNSGVVAQARLALEALAGQPLPEVLLPQGQGRDAGQKQGNLANPGSAQGTKDLQNGRINQDDTTTALPQLPAGLPATVLLQRPDLRAAEQGLQAAAFDVGAARAARFPRLTLTANAGTRSTELDGLLRSGSGFFSLLPTLELPIFDAGARRAQVQVNEATQRQALAQYEAALQAAFREVADALAVRDSLAERLAAQQAQVAAAQRSLELAEQSYRLGSASQLELLDAQRQLASARQGLVAVRQTEQVNRVALLRALGGRWTGG